MGQSLLSFLSKNLSHYKTHAMIKQIFSGRKLAEMRGRDCIKVMNRGTGFDPKGSCPLISHLPETFSGKQGPGGEHQISKQSS